MQKHMLYVQSFTFIKSAGARISSTGSGGIPSPTVQNILITHLFKSHHHFTLVYRDYYVCTYIDHHKIYMRNGNLSGKCEIWGF
jgi:hypothetical protein